MFQETSFGSLDGPKMPFSLWYSLNVLRDLKAAGSSVHRASWVGVGSVPSASLTHRIFEVSGSCSGHHHVRAKGKRHRGKGQPLPHKNMIWKLCTLNLFATPWQKGSDMATPSCKEFWGMPSLPGQPRVHLKLKQDFCCQDEQEGGWGGLWGSATEGCQLPVGTIPLQTWRKWRRRQLFQVQVFYINVSL